MFQIQSFSTIFSFSLPLCYLMKNTGISTYEFKQGLPLELEIVDLSELYRSKREMLITPHRTRFYHIIWVQKGTPTHIIDFNPVQLKENSLTFLNKDVVHIYDPLEFEGKAILFTESFFSKTELDSRFLKDSILFNDLFTVSTFQLDSTMSIFRNLFELMENEIGKHMDAFQPELLRTYLQGFLLNAERERRKLNFVEVQKGTDKDYIVLFKDLLETSYRNRKPVGYYSSELGVTEKRLNQATTKVLGKTIKQMIDDRLMLEAKRLLAHTTDSIKEIGFILGFDEPTNFIKYFRKHNLSTPVEFRERFLRERA